MAMHCDGEVMHFDDGPLSLYENHYVVIILNQGCPLEARTFRNTIGATKRGSPQGHNGR